MDWACHPWSPARSHPDRQFSLAVTPVSLVSPWKRAGAERTGTSLKCGKLGADPCGPSERAPRRASKCVGWCCQRSAAATGSVAIGLDLSQGGERHAEMLGNLGGLHAGQERRSDRIALRLRDFATTPLRSTSRPPRSGYRSAPGSARRISVFFASLRRHEPFGPVPMPR
jgi:hypothetical protein